MQQSIDKKYHEHIMAMGHTPSIATNAVLHRIAREVNSREDRDKKTSTTISHYAPPKPPSPYQSNTQGLTQNYF